MCIQEAQTFLPLKWIKLSGKDSQKKKKIWISYGYFMSGDSVTMFAERTFTISDWRCSGSSLGVTGPQVQTAAEWWDWEAALLGELDLALPVSSCADLCSSFLMSLWLLWEFRWEEDPEGENIPDKMDKKNFIGALLEWETSSTWFIGLPGVSCAVLGVTQRFQDLCVFFAFLHQWNGSGITTNQLTDSAWLLKRDLKSPSDLKSFK